MDRGVKITNTYQLNVGGNTDFLNMLNRGRLASKKISKNRKQLEKDEVPRDYKAELIELFNNMEKYFTTDRKLYVAKRYRNFFLQVHTIVNQQDCREIYEGLIKGDPKLRSFRALYQRIFGRYVSEAKKAEKVVNLDD